MTTVLSGTLAAKTMKELCEERKYVVRGKIVSVGKTIDVPFYDGFEMVYDSAVKTEYFVEVSEVFKGEVQVGDVVPVWVQGGETATAIVTVEGRKMPEIGEKHFFFIDADDWYYPCGFIKEDATVNLWEVLVPEWFVGNKETVPYHPVKAFPAEQVAELIRSYVTKISG